MPEPPSQTLAEYRAVTAGAALVALPWPSWLRVTGQHRERFLHNLTTCQVKGLVPGQGAHGASLTHKGRLVGQLIVEVEAEAILLELDRDRRDAVREHLQRHIVADRVAFAPVDDRAVLALVGPEAPAALARALGVDLPRLRPFGWLACEIGGRAVRLRANHQRLGRPSWDVLVDPGAAVAVAEHLAAHGFTRTALDAWEIARVEAGVPRDGADLDDATVPLESLALARGIAWDKGCYLGQEVVCMTRDLGQPNKQLVLLALRDVTAPPGSDVQDPADGNVVGRLGTSAWSPVRGAPVALAMIRHKLAAPGTKVQVGSEAVEVLALAGAL